MELPQPRPYGAQGKPTHDFLSFYSQIQDPSPPEQGIYPKTHDFLQPLERVDNKNSAYEVSTPEVKPAGPAPSVASSSGEHVLPGGIGTYSIRNVSHFNQRILKPEKSVFTAVETIGVDNNEENSNCSSHTGRGFTLWEESAVKKGKTRKESHSHCIKGAKNGGQWGALERPSQSCSNIATTATTTSFSSRSSSQPELQKNQSFMDMLKSAKAAHDEDDEDEEEYALKKEASPPLLKGELTVRVGSGGGKNMDQKPNTPRSKHSATEQRRRSKINDRFHMLRELIPHSDQKRDKASFLLEVIEYIQYLQEKVHKYEGTYQGWNQELPKSIPWSSTDDVEGYVDQLPNQHNNPVPSMVFSAKFDENGINFSPANPLNSRKTPKSDVKTITQVTEIDHSFGLTTNEEPPMQENIFRPFGNASTVSQPQPQSWQGMPSVPDCDPASNKINENDLTIESGVISISSAYSQGLLNTITQALQSSGVDMSQANISVQIDLGKRTNTNRVTSQDDDVRYSDKVMGSPRGESGVDKPDRDQKRLRTS